MSDDSENQGRPSDPDTPDDRVGQKPPPQARRSWHVVGLFALGASVAGFFTGITREGRTDLPRHEEDPVLAEPAPGYPDLRTVRRGPNAKLYVKGFDRFQEGVPKVLDPVPPQSAGERERVLEARASLRAYDGAPPVIPHAVEGKSTVECLACHEKGAMVAKRRAPAMSHARHDSCTQCHVAAGGPPTSAPPPLTSNAFVGVASAASGARAWAGAPPTIPHSTKMRETCASCHGPVGALGMRSTHPWRDNCQQCHTPSAMLEGRAEAARGLP